MKGNESRAVRSLPASAVRLNGKRTVLPAVMLVLFFFPVFLIRAADKAVREF